jgi:AAA15 family ATPase/GTPase
MLLRLSIKNFLSFYKEIEFDMFPNLKRERFQTHIYTNNKIPLLKQAAIYGDNGSGKSNFIKAVGFLQSFVLDENFLKKIDLKDYKFQLVAKNEFPVSFEIEFLFKNKYYIYSTEISEIISEKLRISNLGESDDILIFERNGNDIKSPYLQNESSSVQLLEMNPQSSLLPLNKQFPILSNLESNHAFDWFSNELEIITMNSIIPMFIDVMSRKSELVNFANIIFKSINIGIDAIEVSNTPFDKWIRDSKNRQLLENRMEQEVSNPKKTVSIIENRKNLLNVSMKNGMQVVQEFLFEQLGQSGYKKKMKISSQSDGTIRILTLIPALYDAIKNQKVVLIDEIENSIHPNLIFALIKYYAQNDSTGQLIFTTHSTHLLNQQVLIRPDEVWLMEKQDGNTKMYSLNDYKIHHTINIENGYLDGRYGGTSMVSEIGNNGYIGK